MAGSIFDSLASCITAEDVRAYRDETGTSMMDAKRDLRKIWVRNHIEEILSAPIEEKVDFLIRERFSSEI